MYESKDAYYRAMGMKNPSAATQTPQMPSAPGKLPWETSVPGGGSQQSTAPGGGQLPFGLGGGDPRITGAFGDIGSLFGMLGPAFGGGTFDFDQFGTWLDGIKGKYGQGAPTTPTPGPTPQPQQPYQGPQLMQRPRLPTRWG